MLAYLHWNLDPTIVEIGPIALRYYGVCFAAGFLIGYSIIQRIFKQEGKPEKDLDSLCVALVVGTIVGARLGHCLFYHPAEYLADPISILKVWEGGLASHGGVIGNLVALWFYARKRPDQSYLWLLDRIVIPTALAAALIRIGNFFNSEIVGIPTTKPWGVVFERFRNEGADGPARHPAQLYESLCYLLIFGFMVWLYRRRRALTPHGLLLGWFFVLLFTARFFVEFVKVPQKPGVEEDMLRQGQFLSIPFILVGIWLIWSSRKRVPSA
ncbi:MAG: prolipoprotein diacylglyceryl transferase [Planctomycetota bacterium]|jgi:prolipoprotein diacylglyceryl transferase